MAPPTTEENEARDLRAEERDSQRLAGGNDKFATKLGSGKKTKNGTVGDVNSRYGRSTAQI